MKILFNNILSQASLSATNEDANYPVSNLRSNFLRKKFQATEEYSTVSAEFLTPVTINSAYAMYHNKDRKIKVFESGSTTYKYLTEDCDACHFPSTNVSKVQVELGDNVVENGEFYSGSTGWTLGTGASVMDATALALAGYGTPMPGGSGKTLVIVDDGSGGIEVNTTTWPTVQGDQFVLSFTVKPQGTPTTDGTFRFRWQISDGTTPTQTTITVLKTAPDWVTTTQTITCPSGFNITKVWFDYVSQASDFGTWLVGSVKVYRLTGDKAYLGGLGVGSSYDLRPPESFWDESFDDRSIVSESQTGQSLQEYVEPLRVHNFTYSGMDRDEARALEAEYVATGKGKPLFVDFDTDGLTPLYCKITDAITVSKNKRIYTGKISFREAR